MDHIFAVGADGYLPLRKGAKAELAKRPNGIYIPRFRNVREKQQGFVRGYGYQGGESVTVFEQAYSMPGFGADWKARVKSETVARIGLTGFGEMLARRRTAAISTRTRRTPGECRCCASTSSTATTRRRWRAT